MKKAFTTLLLGCSLFMCGLRPFDGAFQVVAAAEVEHQDIWRSAGLAIVAVTDAEGNVEAHLQHIVRWIEHNRPEVEVVDAQFELR